jgi:hypothetical protein
MIQCHLESHLFSLVVLFGIHPQALKPAISKFWNKDCLILHPTQRSKTLIFFGVFLIVMSFLLSQCHLESRNLFLLWHYLKSAHKPTSQQWAKFKTRTVLFYTQLKGPKTWFFLEFFLSLCPFYWVTLNHAFFFSCGTIWNQPTSPQTSNEQILKQGLTYWTSNQRPTNLIYFGVLLIVMSFPLSQCHLQSRILFLLWHYLKSAHKPTNQQWTNFETRTDLLDIQPKGPQTWFILEFYLLLCPFHWVSVTFNHAFFFSCGTIWNQPTSPQTSNEQNLRQGLLLLHPNQTKLHPNQRPTNLWKKLSYCYSYVLSIDSVSSWTSHSFSHAVLFGISPQAHKPVMNKFLNKDRLILHPRWHWINRKDVTKRTHHDYNIFSFQVCGPMGWM